MTTKFRSALRIWVLGSALLPAWGRAGESVSTRQALDRQQEAEKAYYQTLRKSPPGALASESTLQSTRARTVGPSLAALSQARANEIDRGLAKFGLRRGTVKDVNHEGSVDRGLGEAGFDSMMKTGAPSAASARKIASSSSQQEASDRAPGMPRANPQPSLRPSTPIEPSPVLDGAGIPRYLQFRGKKK